MIQKIVKVGNSTGVIIPKELVNELQLQIGRPVVIDYDKEDDVIKVIYRKNQIKKKKSLKQSLKKSRLDPEFIAWSNKFVEDNKELFKELANR